MNSAILFTKNGTPFIVDEERADEVSRKIWHQSFTPSGTYIGTGQNRDGNFIALHHFILRTPSGGNHIHHKNGDTQDNRKQNLEDLSRGDNIARGRNRKSNTGIRGAYQRGNRFLSQIAFKSKIIHIGRFDTAEEAGSAFLKKRIELRGF